MGLFNKIRGSIMQTKFYSNLASNKRLQSKPLETTLSENKNKVLQSVTPLGKVSTVGKIGLGIKEVFQKGGTLLASKTINPAAGVTGAKNIVKTLLGKTATGATVGATLGGGYLITKAATSGNVPKPEEVAKTLTKTTITGAGYGLNPVGGLSGALVGTGIATAENTSAAAKNFWNIIKGQGQSLASDARAKFYDATNKFNDIKENLPTSPNLQPNITMNFTTPEMPNNIMPQTPQTFFIEQPQIQTPSFSPSVSMGGLGGGLSENLPLLLLLGAGLGGYAIGRRKRKSKKYKKKKRRK